MSENAPQHHVETLPNGELDALIEAHASKTSSQEAAKAEAALHASSETASEAAKAEAPSVNPLEKIQADEAAASSAAQPTHVNAELKNITLKREIKNIQRKLPKSQRTLSKVVHQPAIKAVSELSAKSLTRPSGLLGGGLLAFVGSLSYLIFTKYIGVTYNYSIFLALFIGGFVLGLALELVVWSVTSRHHHQG